MRFHHFFRIVSLISLGLPFAVASAAQDGPTSRSVTSNDFAAQRPQRPRAQGRPQVRVTPRTYKLTRTEKNVARWKKPKKPVQPPPANSPIKVTEIGVTMWKVRPPKSREVGKQIPCKDETGTIRMCIAERVPTDTPFKMGDKVRFAVESSDAGYLYIIDRETFADGTFGDPILLFPESEQDDNQIGPGMLFDLPDQREEDPPPYFLFEKRSKGNSVLTGDMLTVIVSPKPLVFETDKMTGKIKDDDALVAMESVAEVEIFNRTDKADRIFSNAEAEASCGPKTRSLAREKSGSRPCTRQLFREESAPQALYRVKGQAGQPAVAFVRLSLQQ